MKIWEFEKKVQTIEGIQIVVRASINDEVGNYEYEKQFNGKKTISDWKSVRLDECLCKHEYEIIDGNGIRPHGNILMLNLRNSY